MRSKPNYFEVVLFGVFVIVVVVVNVKARNRTFTFCQNQSIIAERLLFCFVVVVDPKTQVCKLVKIR